QRHADLRPIRALGEDADAIHVLHVAGDPRGFRVEVEGHADGRSDSTGPVNGRFHRRLLVERGDMVVTGAAQRTLSKSRRPSPIMLIASTASARKRPGKRMIQKASCT